MHHAKQALTSSNAKRKLQHHSAKKLRKKIDAASDALETLAGERASLRAKLEEHRGLPSVSSLRLAVMTALLAIIILHSLLFLNGNFAMVKAMKVNYYALILFFLKKKKSFFNFFFKLVFNY